MILRSMFVLAVLSVAVAALIDLNIQLRSKITVMRNAKKKNKILSVLYLVDLTSYNLALAVS